MSKMTFWALLALLLIMNTIPLGEQTNRRLNTRIAKDSELTRLDFMLHLFSFMALSFPFALAQRGKKYVFRAKAICKFALITVGCALTFETIQAALPYRAFNPKDLVFNLVGAALGIVIVMAADASRGFRKVG